MALPNLRSIFASSRTTEEERQLSRVTFYKFTVFVASCLVISLVANRNSSNRAASTEAAKAIVGMAHGGKLV